MVDIGNKVYPENHLVMDKRSGIVTVDLDDVGMVFPDPVVNIVLDSNLNPISDQQEKTNVDLCRVNKTV